MTTSGSGQQWAGRLAGGGGGGGGGRRRRRRRVVVVVVIVGVWWRWCGAVVAPPAAARAFRRTSRKPASFRTGPWAAPPRSPSSCSPARRAARSVPRWRLRWQQRRRCHAALHHRSRPGLPSHRLLLLQRRPPLSGATTQTCRAQGRAERTWARRQLQSVARIHTYPPVTSVNDWRWSAQTKAPKCSWQAVPSDSTILAAAKKNCSV